MHNTEPDTDAQREQSLPRCPHKLTERLLDLRWQRTLDSLDSRHDLRRGYLLHGGSSCPRGLGWRLSRSQHERTRREDRHSKFYEVTDNLDDEKWVYKTRSALGAPSLVLFYEILANKNLVRLLAAVIA